MSTTPENNTIELDEQLYGFLNDFEVNRRQAENNLGDLIRELYKENYQLRLKIAELMHQAKDIKEEEAIALEGVPSPDEGQDTETEAINDQVLEEALSEAAFKSFTDYLLELPEIEQLENIGLNGGDFEATLRELLIKVLSPSIFKVGRGFNELSTVDKVKGRVLLNIDQSTGFFEVDLETLGDPDWSKDSKGCVHLVYKDVRTSLTEFLKLRPQLIIMFLTSLCRALINSNQD